MFCKTKCSEMVTGKKIQTEKLQTIQRRNKNLLTNEKTNINIITKKQIITSVFSSCTLQFVYSLNFIVTKIT